MTQMNEWERLPWLLSRKEVLRWSGLTRYDIRKLVAAGVLHRHAGTRGKYFKSELIKICKVN